MTPGTGNERPWHHLWLYVKGWYQESENRYEDLIKAQAAHTCTKPRLQDVALVLEEQVLGHIACYTSGEHARQGVRKLLGYMDPYRFGSDERTHLERKIDGFVSYMQLEVMREPSEFNTFILGDIGAPDENVLPIAQLKVFEEQDQSGEVA